MKLRSVHSIWFILALLGANLGFGQTSVTQASVAGISDAGEGDLYLTSDTDRLYMGIQTGTLREIGTNGNGSSWLLGGNTSVTTGQFLGIINDQVFEIRSNNLPMLRFGRRQTLGLTQGFPDYDDNDQPLVLLNGNGSTSALQFTASGASFYRPMFFTTTNGSFRLKGSAGGTDLFEMGSAGNANNGRMEFIIGDDGNEPFIFKRYDYRNGRFHTEFFRVQGSDGSANAKTRFGININPAQVAIPANYYDVPDAGSMANSTLQIGGSLATAIVTTSGNLTLNEDHYSVILGGNHSLGLPPASSCTGRVYMIKNPNAFATTISAYTNTAGTTGIGTVNNNSVLWLQSDGTQWQQINQNGGNLIKHAEYGFGSALELNTASLTAKDFFSTEISNDGMVTRTNNSTLRIDEAGIYQITFNSSINTINPRTNVWVQLFVNNAASRVVSANNYKRNLDGHQTASANFSVVLRLSQNDTLQIRTQREANSGNSQAQPATSLFTLTKMGD
ncbi:hypothetical protein [Sediminicola luteus]|uniref:Uncharacterized protein n=1 Tax=Sediminicola luteus TaxID=319238 RepID=A0A2A4G440_9FLAO|nr:hypothetical protein [Sediminicola luteus]PCE63437.1 hypothetical protein B7P33_14590 [Sediminicola luteus]